MKQPSPTTDPQMMEGSEVKSVSEESRSVGQLHNNLSDVKEEESSHNGEDEAETCSRPKDELQLKSKLIEITTDVEVDTNAKQEAQTCSQELLDEKKFSNDASTNLNEGDRPPLTLSTEAAAICRTPANTQGEAETPSSVLEGKVESLLTFDAAPQNDDDQPSLLVAGCSAESSPVEPSDSTESLSSSSVQSTSKNSPTDSATTSGISNGPSTPTSDTLSSSPASSPQTSANNSGPSNSTSSPYDTDCSRRLISQIQRSLSQESLLDELESELLACQLPDEESRGERKGSPPVNGLPVDQDGCMVVFEKCVQYKCAQQEKAIQK